MDATTAAFGITNTDTQTFVITDAMTITTTDDDGDMTNVQTVFTDNGATLTLMSSGDTLILTRRNGAGTGNDLTLANLQGTYDLDVVNSSPLDIGDEDFIVMSAELIVMDNNATFTATGINTVTYVIANASEVRITEADGDVVVLRTTLTDNAMRLRTVDPDGNIFVFDKR